jgi:hypothetical protein
MHRYDLIFQRSLGGKQNAIEHPLCSMAHLSFNHSDHELPGQEGLANWPYN